MSYSKKTETLEIRAGVFLEYTEWQSDDLNPSNELPIVCLHGHMAGMELFNHFTFPALEAACAKWFMAINLPGYGESSELEEHTVPECTTALLEFLEAKGISKCHLVGVSLGGSIALHLAAHHPTKVATVSVHEAVYEGNTQFSPVVQKIVRGWYALPDPLQRILEYLHHWRGAPRLRGMLTNRVDLRLFDHLGPEYFSITSGILNKASWRAMNEYSKSLMDFEIDLMGMDMPVLITKGENTVFRARRRLMDSDMLPEADRAIVPRGGHMAPYSTPEEFANILMGFLNKHSEKIRG